jgi:glycosyltransferase involved in cell wall biosynthesis
LIEETFAEVPESVLGELIVIDDASDDGTGAEIKALTKKYPTLRYVRHGARAGQSVALRNGVLLARYPVIASMDGDGQNDPADIMPLLKTLVAKVVSLPWPPVSGPDVRDRAHVRPHRVSPIGSATKCSPTAAQTPAVESRSIGGKPLLSFHFSRRCTAICRRYS